MSDHERDPLLVELPQNQPGPYQHDTVDPAIAENAQRVDRLYRYDDPERPRFPVERAVLEGALIRMKNAVRGNGIDPATIEMTFFEGETLHFHGRSIFKIIPNIAEKTVAGRESAGTVCGSVEQLRLNIRQIVENTHYDRNVTNHACDTLDQRPDKGFAVNNLPIKFDRLNKTLIAHHSCSNCTAGHLACGTCQGSKMQPCQRCHGQQNVPCPQCRGTGQANFQGKMQTCRKCSGHRHIRCTQCQGQGRVNCRTCNGSGQAKCQRCNGTGFISDIAYVSFEGKSHCTFDDESLPPELPEIILKAGPGLASEKHAAVEILREEDHHEAQQTYENTEKPRENDGVIVPYYIRLPYGTVRFRISDKPEMEGRLFGQHPRLLGLPPFLEEALAPGLTRLDQAAAKAGPVRRNIEEAIRYRAIGDAILVAATHPPKKAAALLHKKWSLGLRHETTDQMTLMADRAFRNLSLLPRVLGLIGGLGLGAGLGTLWLLMGRTSLSAHHIAEPVLLGGDVMIVAAGATLGVLGSQYLTRYWVSSVLGRLIPKPKPGKKPMKILPRAGQAVTGQAILGSAGLFAGLIYGLHYFAALPLPGWVQQILMML